jgi:hypothetical protein
MKMVYEDQEMDIQKKSDNVSSFDLSLHSPWHTGKQLKCEAM